MGYDMNWVSGGTDEELLTLAAIDSKLVEARRAAGAFERETQEHKEAQEVVSGLYDERDAANCSYFHLNIWGMGDARQALYAVGVMNAAQHAPFPTLEEYGLADHPQRDDEYVEWNPRTERWEVDGEPVTPTPKELTFLEANRDVLCGPPPGDTHGIPLYKVGSNDGWVVTPMEIATGLAWADHHHEGWRDGLEPYIREFVAWITLAYEHQGFQVW